jgi:hypothetical protein
MFSVYEHEFMVRKLMFIVREHKFIDVEYKKRHKDKEINLLTKR